MTNDRPRDQAVIGGVSVYRKPDERVMYIGGIHPSLISVRSDIPQSSLEHGTARALGLFLVDLADRCEAELDKEMEERKVENGEA